MRRLGIFSAGDVINYAFLVSRLQINSLQAKSLANSDLATLGMTFEHALGVFCVLCGSNALSLNDESAAPQSWQGPILMLLRTTLCLATCSAYDKLSFLVSPGNHVRRIFC